MKPRRGIMAQEKALTFETPFFDGAQGIIAMILALLVYTTLFSRPVIDIQNMLLNIMTLDKKKQKKQKNKEQQQGRTDACKSPVVCPSPYAKRMAVFNVTVLRVSR